MVGHWWQGVILIVVVHMVGLGIVRGFTRIIKGLGLWLGEDVRAPEVHGCTGEKVSMARLGAK
jgi:hypothetical protein